MNFLHIGKLAESQKNEKNTVKSMKNKKNPRNAQVTGILNIGDPAGVRTPDPLLKRQMLCRLSYRIICFSGWDDRTRTCNIRVKVWCVAITLHPIIQGTGLKRNRDWDLPQSLFFSGVGKGTRTLDTRNHNPVL